jgi:hypothetical protein
MHEIAITQVLSGFWWRCDDHLACIPYYLEGKALQQDHSGVYEDILYQFHVRLGHQSCAAIEDLATKPESGIKLTDRKKPHGTCAEGKQSHNNQSKKDSGNNVPIRRIVE